MTAAVPAIAVRQLSKTFGDGELAVHAVSGIDLDVATGEVVLVMGPSGSGKTTLLLMLGAMLRPTGGSVVIDGVDLATAPERRLPSLRATHLGFIFQDFNLLSALSALENVQLACNLAGTTGRAARDRATELLDRVGLGHRLGFRPDQLSGGENQARSPSPAPWPTTRPCCSPTSHRQPRLEPRPRDRPAPAPSRRGGRTQHRHRQPRRALARGRRPGPVAGGRRVPGACRHGHRSRLRHGRGAGAGHAPAGRRPGVVVLLERLPSRLRRAPRPIPAVGTGAMSPTLHDATTQEFVTSGGRGPGPGLQNRSTAATGASTSSPRSPQPEQPSPRSVVACSTARSASPSKRAARRASRRIQPGQTRTFSPGRTPPRQVTMNATPAPG